jgi:hypothetical protein
MLDLLLDFQPEDPTDCFYDPFYQMTEVEINFRDVIL